MNIEEYLSNNDFKSKYVLMKEMGLKDERTVRLKLSELKLKKPVIYNSQTTGYRLPKSIKNISIEELEKEIDLVEHARNDINSRNRVFEMQKSVYNSWLDEAKRELIRKKYL